MTDWLFSYSMLIKDLGLISSMRLDGRKDTQIVKLDQFAFRAESLRPNPPEGNNKVRKTTIQTHIHTCIYTHTSVSQKSQ